MYHHFSIVGGNDEPQLGERKRRWWPWIVAAVILLVAGWAALAGRHQDEFAFFDHLHPTRIPQPDLHGFRRYVLIFPKTTADDVVKTLYLEMPSRGWQNVYRSKTTIAAGHFYRGHGSLVENVAWQGVAAYPTHASGSWTYDYEEGESAVEISVAPPEPSWFDRQLNAVRAGCTFRERP